MYCQNKNNFNLNPVLTISDKEKLKAKTIIEKMGLNVDEKFIMLCLSGKWQAKKWPLENWIELIKKLSFQKIVLLWGPAMKKMSDI